MINIKHILLLLIVFYQVQFISQFFLIENHTYSYIDNTNKVFVNQFRDDYNIYSEDSAQQAQETAQLCSDYYSITIVTDDYTFKRENENLTKIDNIMMNIGIYYIQEYEYNIKVGDKVIGSIYIDYINRNITSYLLITVVFILSQLQVVLFLEKDINKDLKRTIKNNTNDLSSYSEELKQMNEDLEEQYYVLKTMKDKYKKITSLSTQLIEDAFQNDDYFLSRILEYQLDVVPNVDSGWVAVVEDDYITIIDSYGYDEEQLKKIRIDINYIDINNFETIHSSSIFSNEYINIKYYPELISYLQSVFKQTQYSMPIKITDPSGNILGILSLDSKSLQKPLNDYSVEIQKVFESFASAFLTIKKFTLLEKNISKEIILSMISLLEIHDRYTEGHSNRVADMSVQLGEEIGLNSGQLNRLYWSQIVHDIGKLLIPITILNSKGQLSSEEFEMIKEHPKFGYNVLKRSQSTKNIAKNVLYHHERWDGTGYPEGISKTNIPLFSRIIQIADQYDAMTSTRSYRDEMSKSEQIKEIKTGQGSQFDPYLQEIFIKIINE